MKKRKEKAEKKNHSRHLSDLATQDQQKSGVPPDGKKERVPINKVNQESGVIADGNNFRKVPIPQFILSVDYVTNVLFFILFFLLILFIRNRDGRCGVIVWGKKA